MTLKIIGLDIETYTGQSVSGHNCDFTYEPALFKRHIFSCVDLDDQKKYEVMFYHTEGECSSGWCTASWGHYEVTEVAKHRSYSYVPKEDFELDVRMDGDTETIEEKFLSFSREGMDEYYPSGGYTVNMGMFQPVARTKTKPQVFIFNGASATGKSFLAARLKDLQVYETDSAKELPALLPDDVIVIGRKYKHSVQEVLKRIPEGTEPIFVTFTQ